MHWGTAAVISRTSGALPLSRVQASVNEFRRRTFARDERGASALADVPRDVPNEVR